MELEKEEQKKVEKFFGTNKFYLRLVSLIVGIIVIFFLFRKMKMEYDIS